MAPGTRRIERPDRDRRMLSLMLFAQGAILVTLAVVAATRTAWGGALLVLAIGLLFGVIGAVLRKRGH